MQQHVKNKLIIVEGLTGSGKSIMAHFIARQLQRNGIPASWVHEGEEPHPVLIDVESNIEAYMAEMLQRWTAYVDQIASSDQVTVVEACFFNNLIESLFAHNVERSTIIRYGHELEAVIKPLNPVLIYLTQGEVDEALQRNFENRGQGFEDFVIQYATGTPYATHRGLKGYAGMATFWRELVAIKQELLQRYSIQKLVVDNSAGDWDDCNRRVLDFLSIPLVPAPGVSHSEAQRFVGVYRDTNSGKEFAVQYQDGGLLINLFLNVKTRLIREAETVFAAEGWHFEVSFEADSSGNIGRLRIGGRDVDYLALVGTTAEKSPT